MNDRRTEIASTMQPTTELPSDAPAQSGVESTAGRPAGSNGGTRHNRTLSRIAGCVLVLAALLAAPLAVDDFWTFVFATALIYVLAALSVNVLSGQAGMIGLFPAAFLGIGAYSAAVLSAEGAPWLLAFAGAVCVAVVLGALVGLAGTRLRGMTFGIVTLAFALAADTYIFRRGIFGIDPAFGAQLDRPELAGIDMFDEQNFYYFILLIGVVTWIVIFLHERARPGRAWRAIRDNELAALAVGVPVGVYRIWATALAAAVAAVGGVLFVALQGQVSVESFTPVQSLLIFTAAMTAGTRTVMGAVIAGFLLIVLPQLLTEAGVSASVVPLIFAVGVLLSLKGTDGIVGAVQQASARAAQVLRTRRGQTRDT